MKRGIPLMGIIFLIIGLVVASGTYKSLSKDSPLEKETVEDAFYVGSGGPSTGKDGQVVIVSGSVELMTPAYDQEYKLTILSPRATKDTYVYTLDDGEYSWEFDESDDFLGQIMVAGFHISPELLENFRTRTTYKTFDSDELEAAGLRLIEDSNTAQRFFLKTSGNQVRYHYEIFDMDKYDKVTITGKQNGDTLEYVSAMKKFSVVEGDFNQEELIKYMSDSSLTNKIFGVSISILFIVLGISRIRLWLAR